MKKLALSGLAALTLALGMAAFAARPAAADAPLVTISGTVVSLVDEVLVLRTDRGNLTFDLDKSTEMPADIAVGNRITVSYDSDDNPADKMDARKIVRTPEPSAVTPTPVTPTPVTTPTPTASAYEQDEEPSELPATASPLPLAGVAGLLALAGGFLLRRRSVRK